MKLQEFFAQNPKTAVALSGGADSAYVLYAAKKWGTAVAAYCVKTAFQPEFELSDARRLAESMGVPFTVIELDILADASVATNCARRCYYCKRKMLSAIVDRAAADGFNTVLDGTNASDAADDRPGMRALTELSVKSPLRLCGLTKADVRALSREAGLPTWDKPAYACLATRIPTGQVITDELLKKIENTENSLFAMGFTDFRARVRGGAAVLQFNRNQADRAFALWRDIYNEASRYFEDVYFDAKGR